MKGVADGTVRSTVLDTQRDDRGATFVFCGHRSIKIRGGALLSSTTFPFSVGHVVGYRATE
jgi:hypothetical protein